MLSSTNPYLYLLERAGLLGELPSWKELLLPVERLRSLISYDSETGDLRWLYRPTARTEWNTRYAGSIAGSVRDGCIQVRIEMGEGVPSIFLAHRIAWALHYGEWPAHIVDHEDCDSSNNRIGNLRKASSSQNNCNRSVVAGAQKFKGIYFMQSKNRYAAQIKKNRKWEWLGLHDTPEEAARAYDKRAVELHGEFARTNASMGLLQ